MEDNIVNWVQSLSEGNGDGNGFGYGDGNGRGNGYGDGSGYGNGYGDGNGRGRGNGYEYGKGNGRGYGNGTGYRNGYGGGRGDGFGQGYEKGISEISGYKVYNIDGIPTIIYNLNGKANVASGAIIERNSRLKPCFIAKRGNCFAHGKDIHEAVRDAEAKYIEKRPLEERIEGFLKEFTISDRIPASELFRWHNILTGSCEFGRQQFCKEHNINLETDSFTIQEFIELTKDSYGSEAIKELEKKVAFNV